MKKVLVIGSINCDYVINVPKMPETGETLLCGGYELAPGGKGANQAYALAKLGGKVAMLGAVGDDGPGEKLLGNLRAVGVDVSEIMTLPGESTGTAFIFVDSAGSNSILVSQGANLRVNEEYIDRVPLVCPPGQGQGPVSPSFEAPLPAWCNTAPCPEVSPVAAPLYRIP